MAVDMIEHKEAPLPIYTEGGHPLMDRWLEPENLNALLDASASPVERAKSATAIVQADGRLYGDFLQAATHGKIVHVELSQLMAMNLHVTALQASLFDQATAATGKTLPPELLTQIGQFYVALYNEVVVACTQRSGFSMGDRSIVLNSAAFYYAKVDSFIDADSRAQLHQKFQGLRDEAKLPGDVRNLDKLLAATNH